MVTDVLALDEEEAVNDLFSWHCYKDRLRTFTQYKSLQELCAGEGIPEYVVRNAIAHNNGNWGGYHFVHCTRTFSSGK